MARRREEESRGMRGFRTRGGREGTGVLGKRAENGGHGEHDEDELNRREVVAVAGRAAYERRGV